MHCTGIFSTAGFPDITRANEIVLIGHATGKE